MNNAIRSIIRRCIDVRLLRITTVIAFLMCGTLRVASQMQVEYFWDIDDGLGRCTRVNSAITENGEVSFDLFTDELTSDIHCLGIRAFVVSDTVSYYSPTFYYYVLKLPEKKEVIDDIEYFWDTDPGYGNGIKIPFDSGNIVDILDFEPNIEGLRGIHTLYVRAHSKGGWSACTYHHVKIDDGKLEVIDDIEYFWDTDPGYGNGIKIPFDSGNIVDILDFEPNIEGLRGNHTFYVRAHSKGGWSVIYSSNVYLAAEGLYTLDNTLPVAAKRNFISLDDFFAYVDTMDIASDITLEIVDGGAFSMDLRSDEAKQLIGNIGNNFIGKECVLEFRAKNNASIEILVDPEDVVQVLEIIKFIVTDNVVLKVNEETFDFGLLNYRFDEICNGGNTELREWSTISKLFNVEWSRVDNGNINDAPDAGVGDFPVLKLTNNSLYTDSVCYRVQLMYQDEVLYDFDYIILVKPNLEDVKPQFLQPQVGGAVVNPGILKLEWKKIDKGLTYVVELETIAKDNGAVVCDTLYTIDNTYSFTVKNGYCYRYRVKAFNQCGETLYSVDSIASYDINKDDLQSLRLMYDSLGGQFWNKKWFFDMGDYSSLYYSGVVLNENDRVASVNLENSALAGSLPSENFNLPETKVMKLKNNKLMGDAAAFAACCPSLETLDLSYNCITDISIPFADNIKTLSIENQFKTASGGVSEAIDSLPLNDIVMNINGVTGLLANNVAWYVHKMRSFDGHPIFRVWDREFKNVLGEMIYSGDSYKLTLSNEYTQGQGADVLFEVSSGDSKGSLYPGRFSYVEGDANVDTELDIRDVQHLLNYVVGPNGALGAFNRSASNVYDDDIINVQDVVVMVNMLLNSRSVKRDGYNKVASSYMLTDHPNLLYKADGNIILSLESEVAALDIELSGVKAEDVKFALPSSVFDVISTNTESGCRIIIISFTGETLQRGTTLLMSVGSDAFIVRAMAADIDAKAVPLYVNNGSVTSIAGMAVYDDVSVVVSGGELYIKSARDFSNVTATLYSTDGREIHRYRDRNLIVGLNRLVTDYDMHNGVYLLELLFEDSYRCVMRVVF